MRLWPRPKSRPPIATPTLGALDAQELVSLLLLMNRVGVEECPGRVVSGSQWIRLKFAVGMDRSVFLSAIVNDGTDDPLRSIAVTILVRRREDPDKDFMTSYWLNGRDLSPAVRELLLLKFLKARRPRLDPITDTLACLRVQANAQALDNTKRAE